MPASLFLSSTWSVGEAGLELLFCLHFQCLDDTILTACDQCLHQGQASLTGMFSGCGSSEFSFSNPNTVLGSFPYCCIQRKKKKKKEPFALFSSPDTVLVGVRWGVDTSPDTEYQSPSLCLLPPACGYGEMVGWGARGTTCLGLHLRQPSARTGTPTAPTLRAEPQNKALSLMFPEGTSGLRHSKG